MADTALITIANDTFSEVSITVLVGTTVTWEHQRGLPHTITADDELFDSGRLIVGDTFSYTFEQPGTYPYYCMYHGGPGGREMSGVVIVTAE